MTEEQWAIVSRRIVQQVKAALDENATELRERYVTATSFDDKAALAIGLAVKVGPAGSQDASVKTAMNCATRYQWEVDDVVSLQPALPGMDGAG